jgi:acid-sensing ion channel, other
MKKAMKNSHIHDLCQVIEILLIFIFENFLNILTGAGSHFGLSLLLDGDVGNYYCSSTSSSGFKALLHSPIETPKLANFGFFIEPGRETKIVITPKISEATDLIRKVPMQQRQCVFAVENNLSYYNVYSKKNCESECISNLTERECGCTLYFMPRKNDNESKICNRAQAKCYEDVIYKIQNTMNSNLSCNCLPACFEINYGREISSCPLGTGSFKTVESLPSRYNSSYIRENLALVHIFFNDNAYSGFTKNELIGFTEFLSNTGGLLGKLSFVQVEM